MHVFLIHGWESVRLGSSSLMPVFGMQNKETFGWQPFTVTLFFISTLDYLSTWLHPPLLFYFAWIVPSSFQVAIPVSWLNDSKRYFHKCIHHHLQNHFLLQGTLTDANSNSGSWNLLRGSPPLLPMQSRTPFLCPNDANFTPWRDQSALRSLSRWNPRLCGSFRYILVVNLFQQVVVMRNRLNS